MIGTAMILAGTAMMLPRGSVVRRPEKIIAAVPLHSAFPVGEQFSPADPLYRKLRLVK